MSKVWCCAGVLVALAWTCAARAQSPGGRSAGQGPRRDQVQSDPIKCWWKADRAAVRVGERFGVVLTCAVIETGSITVAPALNQLEPGALSLTPFEVVSGTRGGDLVVPPWRYIQFNYAVRLLNEGFFGQDVMIPGVSVTYNLQTPGGTQGRDKTYVLPALPMRILSLVPRGASDIRDASGQTFAGVESRRFRSSLALVLSWISFAFGAVLAVFAVVQAVRVTRARKAAAARALPPSSVLGGCLKALEEVASDSRQEGWSPELARRAAAAVRIAGAIALDQPVMQDFVSAAVLERDGQITVRAGWMRPRRVLLSSSVTAKAIGNRLENGSRLERGARVRLESISEALGALSVAGYGRNGKVDASALDAAMSSSMGVIRLLRASARWPMRTASAVLRPFAPGS